MSILVTGGAGYIGSHMVLELLDHGEHVVVLDNLSAGFRWAVPETAEFVEGDVGDADLLKRLFRSHDIEAVIHFAGSIIVPESVTDPLKYYRNNTANARELIEATVTAGTGIFIFSSTAAVYGMPGLSPIDEATPLDPISPYGTSKLMTELMLRDTATAHDLRYAALRYFNVAGADPHLRTGQSTPQATHLIKIASQTALGQRDRMDVFGTDYNTRDGTCIRDYIHVCDLARAHTAALEHLLGGGEPGVFNCGYGRGYTVLEVIDAVKKASGKDFAVALADRRAGDPDELVADAGKARRMLKWVPQLDDLDTIVTHALAWEDRLHGMPRG